ncbi:unnamed protein product [Peniophora sp. CBMAI 1063]|nr:unnamed protein product [Peniophora sp. CBMAI 1063]
MPQPIVLYDLMRQVPGGHSDAEQSWSPNTMKTRYALNIKGLQFKTEWIGFGAVGRKMKELGLPPHPDSYPGPKYTVPTIYDPNTDKYVTESFAIARYLDETYPDTARLVAPGTAGFQVAYVEKIAVPLMYLTIPALGWPVFEQCGVSEEDKEHLRKLREAAFGRKVDDAEYKDLHAMMKVPDMNGPLDILARHVAANGANALFLAGDSPCHADTAIASVLVSALRILGMEGELCEAILQHSWAGKYVEAMSKWE